MKSSRLMSTILSFAVFLLALALMSPVTVAQETAAGMQGYVKDQSGAAIPQAAVEVSSPSLIGVKEEATNSVGFYRFANLPPGVYTLTVKVARFRTYKQSHITLDVGALPSIDVQLELGEVAEVIEVSDVAPIVDVTESKAQTVVTRDLIDSIPHGGSFQSVIEFAPGARYEPLQSTGVKGYQIDGASNSENIFLVEGQDIGDIRGGQSLTNAPFEFIQEVVVKSSGFEAEYGGALGGVVNVIQKRGSNAWHGSVFSYYQGNVFNAAPTTTQRLDPTSGVVGRVDQPNQYYQAKQDHFRIVEPGFEVGGYIKKDRLWAFASSVPRFANTTRTVHFALPVGNRSFSQDINTYYSLARVDALATKKIRLFSTWEYEYQRGAGSSLPGADDINGLFNTSSTQNPDNFNRGIGYVAPNLIYNLGADVTLTPRLVATTRYGSFYNNYSDRGLPVGIRYRWRSSNYTYPPTPGAGVHALDGTAIPAADGQQGGFSTIGANFATLTDAYRRTNFSQDLAYFTNFLGAHSFKVGYAFNRLSNDANVGYNTAQAYLAYGVAYKVLTSNQSVCAAVRAQNLTLYGKAGSPDNTTCQGLWGTVNFRDVGNTGKVSSYNHSIYFQDAWQVAKFLTINAGLRMDKEDLPSYKDAPGFKGISFGFGQKLAPRIGVAYDVLHNGKVKAFASFGFFYDIMKYSLPRNSFGGDYWHDCVYALDVPDYTALIPTRGSDTHFCPASGQAEGTFPAGGLRFLENVDFRQPSNDPSNRLVDPNLKPMRQREYVFGAEWAITHTLAFESRYARKRLDRTIEDSGIITAAGEQFFIVNPGSGINLQPLPATECVGCPTQPGVFRRYDGLELRLTKRPSNNWFGTVSYTYSRLEGNYSGLTSTDVSDGIGRSDPNNNRAFDEPYLQFDSHGKVIDGPLATDRPHTFKAFGSKEFKWWHHMVTRFGMSQAVYSGTPLSSYINVEGAPQFVENRGTFANVTRDPATGDLVLGSISKGARTPMFTQTDFTLHHDFKLSSTNESLRLGFEAYIFNIFNQHIVLSKGQELTSVANGSIPGPNIPANIPPGSISQVNYKSLTTGWDYIATANANSAALNSAYGQPILFQDGRTMRFKIKVTF